MGHCVCTSLKENTKWSRFGDQKMVPSFLTCLRTLTSVNAMILQLFCTPTEENQNRGRLGQWYRGKPGGRGWKRIKNGSFSPLQSLFKNEKSRVVWWGSWGGDHEGWRVVLVWDQGIMGGWDQGMRLMGAGRVYLLYHKTLKSQDAPPLQSLL